MLMNVEKSVGVVSSQLSKELNFFISVLGWDKGTGGSSFRELAVGWCFIASCSEKVSIILLKRGRFHNTLLNKFMKMLFV